jgi:hypothetical protein
LSLEPKQLGLLNLIFDVVHFQCSAFFSSISLQAKQEKNDGRKELSEKAEKNTNKDCILSLNFLI